MFEFLTGANKSESKHQFKMHTASYVQLVTYLRLVFKLRNTSKEHKLLYFPEEEYWDKLIQLTVVEKRVSETCGSQPLKAVTNM